MKYSDFKKIYKSLGLSILSVMRITGKSRSALEKWSQEDIVKESTTAVLFRLAALLQHPPYSLSATEIEQLLNAASGRAFSPPYVKLEGITEEERLQLKKLYIDRLKSVTEMLEIMTVYENDLAKGIDHSNIETSKISKYSENMHESKLNWIENTLKIADFNKLIVQKEAVLDRITMTDVYGIYKRKKKSEMTNMCESRKRKKQADQS